MAKRCIGIEIGSTCLRAVQVLRSGRQFCVEKVFTAPTRRATDSQVEILRSLAAVHGFDRYADVAVSIAPEAVFFRNIETDSAGLQRIQQDASSIPAHHFPIEPEQIVARVCSVRRSADDKFSVVIAAVSEESLRRNLDILAEARIRPVLIGTAPLAAYAAVAANHHEATAGRAVMALIDDRHLSMAVTRDGIVVLVRNIPIASIARENAASPEENLAEVIDREVRVSFQRAFAEEIDADTGFYLAARPSICDSIREPLRPGLPCRIVLADPYAQVQPPSDRDADFPVCVAEGLALRVLAPEIADGVNFLEACGNDTKSPVKIRKEAKTYAALIGAIGVFFLLGLLGEMSHLEASYAELKNRITETFREALPEEKNIVDPLVQLDRKLGSFRQGYQLFAFDPNMSPLHILSVLSSNTPPQADLKVEELLIAGGTVRISGTCGSFESVYKWQRLLQELEGFAAADAKDLQKDPRTGLVHFTVVLSPAREEQI